MKYICYYWTLLFTVWFANGQLSEGERLDTITSHFLDLSNNYKGPTIQDLPIEEGRQLIRDIQKMRTLPKLNVSDTLIQVPFQNTIVNVNLIKPQGTICKKLPALIYFHSGGWALGDVFTHRQLLEQIVNKSGCAVVFVNYSRSPEATYPLANEEAYAVAKWVFRNGDSCGIDISKIAIGGGSAGGNMAAVLAIMAKQRAEFHIVSQILLYPVTDTNLNTKSYHEFSENYYLTQSTMQWFFDLYVPNKADRNRITVAPLKASVEQLKGLPQALIVTAAYDVLRDEGEAYARKLSKAGVLVIAQRYNTIHDFMMLNALANSSPTKLAVNQMIDYLKKTLKN